MYDKLVALFRSRRFYAAVAGAAVTLLQDRLGVSPEQATLVVYTVGAWIIGDSLNSTT